MIRFFIWLDMWVNDKLLRGRWETISHRCWRRIKTKNCSFCGWLCKLLDKVDLNHCVKAKQ